MELIDLTNNRQFHKPLKSVHEIFNSLNTRLLTSEEDLHNKGFKDYYSNELGCTIRETLDGKYIIIGDTPIPMNSAEFKSYLHEVLGLKDETGLTICPKCSKLHFHKSSFAICPQCKLDEQTDETLAKLTNFKKIPDAFVPWRDFQIQQKYNENTKQWEEQIIKEEYDVR